ncbi:MAG TPA: nucleoside deaminase [Polyangia bacterium]|nr:nucleoside deaminase [Polyangia bacterium]
MATRFELTLPDWATDAMAAMPPRIDTIDARMRWVIELARTNFVRDTGGPFAAAVFDETTGRPVSIGVNRVVPGRCSSAHAEVMALSLAQQVVAGHDLGGPGQPAHQIVVNWAPCAMCCGAICWSGVRSVVIAGSGPEMEALTGFDEGPLHPRWQDELQRRGIAVSEGLLRDEALDAFREFAASGRAVYNARKG